MGIVDIVDVGLILQQLLVLFHGLRGDIGIRVDAREVLQDHGILDIDAGQLVAECDSPVDGVVRSAEELDFLAARRHALD